MSKILVTGVSGHLGKAVANSLLNKINASDLTVMVRDAAKASEFAAKGAQVVVADYNDYASLTTAFKGIDKIYLVSGTDLERRAEQQAKVIDAAKAAGVQHIVYTSFQRKNETASSPIAMVSVAHLSTEEKLKSSGLAYTIMLHTLYSDIIPDFAGPQLLQSKTIYLPAEDGKTAFASRADLAEAEANILADATGQYENKLIEMTGSVPVSWAEIAEMVSEIIGEKVNYISPSVEDYSTALKGAGVPAEFIGMLGGFNQAIAQGEFENVTLELETLLGRKPETVQAFLKTVYGA